MPIACTCERYLGRIAIMVADDVPDAEDKARADTCRGCERSDTDG